MIFRRRDRSLIGKTHRHYLPSQRHNHQWSMVINNVDDDVKPINFRYHHSSNTCSSSVVKMKDQQSATAAGLDDDDWSAAGRRLLLSADDTSNSPVSCHRWRCYDRAVERVGLI